MTEAGAKQKATMGQVKALIRRKLRRIPPHEENFLNIYPMMDMMTILLVFLIMQFATESAKFVQSEELQIPYSASLDPVQEAVTIQISATNILVNGQHVVDLRNGQVDPADKQGGSTSFLISRLHTKMQEHRDRLKAIERIDPRNRPFRGDVQIIADYRTPFRTLSEVMYTLGQAEFNVMRFVVLKRPES
ncbi:MAG: biopolymer transporter ExbD [Myxococcota bacterium]|nr:biopolymer transporter ExbD [Myxococcota bacterium]MDW8361420.1 biopolymer transporter ExbD [Myxococcales bacterium]